MHGMRETKSIDEMSDEEVAEYLQQADEKRTAAPSEHQLAGGAPAPYALLILVCSLVGMTASIGLLVSERTLLKDPDSALSCDLNPLVGCSDFLTSEYDTAFFGIPNAVWGLAFFSAIAALAVAFLAKTRVARWLWWLLCLAMVGASAWLGWFWHVSFFVKESLCPFCLVTWAVTIPLIIHTWIRAAQAGHLPCTPKLRGFLVRWRWVIVLVVYLYVFALAYFTIGDKLSYIF